MCVTTEAALWCAHYMFNNNKKLNKVNWNEYGNQVHLLQTVCALILYAEVKASTHLPPGPHSGEQILGIQKLPTHTESPRHRKLLERCGNSLKILKSTKSTTFASKALKLDALQQLCQCFSRLFNSLSSVSVLTFGFSIQILAPRPNSNKENKRVKFDEWTKYKTNS